MPSLVVSVTLSDKTHRMFSGAAQELARILHPQTGPGLIGLIELELAGRSVRGLVDEYLDAIGWSKPVRVQPRRSLPGSDRRPRSQAKVRPRSDGR